VTGTAEDIDGFLRSAEHLDHEPETQPSATSIDAIARDASSAGSKDVVRYSNVQLKRARDLLTRLYAVRRAVRYYDIEHPAAVEMVAAMLDVVMQYHREGVDVRFTFFEGEVLFGEQMLFEESVLFDQLIRDMTALGVGSLQINRGVDLEELTRAMSVLTGHSEGIAEAGGLQAVHSAYGLEHVKIGHVSSVDHARLSEGDAATGTKAAYSAAVSLVREIDRLVKMDRHVPASKVKSAVRSLVQNVTTNRYGMLQLTGLRNYHEYTFYHSANVAILSLALGSMITSDQRFLSSLGTGALLHDIGKLAVDSDILNKPGALTPEEWATVRHHPIHGAEMVSLLPGVDKSAVVTILEHHMRMDGSGYPASTRDHKQHLASRIVAITDVYDAMTSKRSYSAARVQDEAMLLLVKSAGTALDPVLVRLFVRLMGIYPPRSVVRLSDGGVAVVLQPNPDDPRRPLIRVIADHAGSFVQPVDLDLASDDSMAIVGCIDPRLLNIDVEDYVN
jgi:HD-GYP domain-containing protein (c-di-GMP phosphodiesterase class II)